MPPRPSGSSWAPAQIPAGGVLPLMGACSDPNCSTLRGVTVITPTSQIAVAGRFELLHEDYNDAWGYFVPEQPFTEGTTLLVTGTYPTGPSTSTQVVAASSLDPSSVGLDVQLTTRRDVLASKCCPAVRGDGHERCLDTSFRTGAALMVQLAMTNAAASQYLFALSASEVGASEPQAQTELEPGMATRPSVMAGFDGTASSYCYGVRARPLTGGPTVDLLTQCVDNDLEGIGQVDRTPEEVERWLSTCERQPHDAGTVAAAEEDGDDDQSAQDGGHDVGRAVATEGCGLTRESRPVSGLGLCTLVALALCLRSSPSRRGRARGARRR